MFDEIEIDTK